MDAWVEEQLQMLLSVKTKEQLFFGLKKAAGLLEFDYFAYGLRVSIPISTPKIELLNNYPSTWQKVYNSNDYVTIDPTVIIGSQTTKPIIWEEKLFSQAGQLWEDARSFGLNHGWAQSAHSGLGVSGLMTLSRSSEELSNKELAKKTPLLVWLTQMAHLGLQDILLPELLPIVNVKLTKRETEILRWTADGNTSCEVSMIIGIGEGTVNFHLCNAMEKLNVVNKTAAAVKAVQLGLI